MLIFLVKEFIVSKNKEPIVLPKEKIRGTYITLDTIRTPLMKGDISVDAYRIADSHIDLKDSERDCVAEQFIYRITGVYCKAYDNVLYRALLCVTKGVCCDVWTERKQNIIILPEPKLLNTRIYWLTVFELVYKLKYPQSKNPNKCLVYALNCMLKASMLSLDNFMNIDNVSPRQHIQLYGCPFRSLRYYTTVGYFKNCDIKIPKSVYRYYTWFGKRLKRMYKNDQMPKEYTVAACRLATTEDIVSLYTDALCECIKLNPPIDAKDIHKCSTKRRNKEAYFADVRQMCNNTNSTYMSVYLYVTGTTSLRPTVYANPYVFVNEKILQRLGSCSATTSHIRVGSEYDAEKPITANTVNLLHTVYHEYAHAHHWRARPRQGDVDTNTAHQTKKCGATYEHQADKFAVWCLIIYGIPLDKICDTYYHMFGTVRDGYYILHSSNVIFRYSMMLEHIYSKYGKLCIPPDLGYVFVNRETGKLYKPNEEIKSITKASDN